MVSNNIMKATGQDKQISVFVPSLADLQTNLSPTYTCVDDKAFLVFSQQHKQSVPRFSFKLNTRPVLGSQISPHPSVMPNTRNNPFFGSKGSLTNKALNNKKTMANELYRKQHIKNFKKTTMIFMSHQTHSDNNLNAFSHFSLIRSRTTKRVSCFIHSEFIRTEAQVE